MSSDQDRHDDANVPTEVFVPGAGLPLAAKERIDRICSVFEEQCQAGGRPDLERFLTQVPDPEQAVLLGELLVLELAYRRRAGEKPAPEEYLTRIPQHAQVIADLFQQFRKTGSRGGPGTSPDAGAPETSLAGKTGGEETGTGCEASRENAGRGLSGKVPDRGLAGSHDQVDTPLSDGARIGRYVIRQKLGRGGFGTVYLARDEELQRLVAIKVPHRDHLSSSAQIDRLIEEARTVARLKHPGIVPVYDVGRQEDGTPFIVMEYVDGVSLAGLLKSGRLAPPRAVALMVQIAEAAHNAHKQGFVHRDLKPGNVLLDAEGNAHLADFGLAVHDSTQRQHAGEYAGSVAYMSPEQVRGETHRLDGRADIWSLGVILYQMLTERCPFAGDNLQEICDEILHRSPKPPRQIDDTIPAELERICLKCLAKQAGDRYLTARDLARDLRAWDRPRRHDAMPLVIAVLALLVLLPAGYFLWRAAPAKQEAVPAPQRPQFTPVPDPKGQQSTTSPRPAASARPPVVSVRPAGEPLDGSVDLLVWSPWDASRRGLRMSQPRALPLRAADQVRIEAQLNRPAYVYLLWIDSEGKVSPVYPWTPGRWGERPSGELPARHLALPEKPDEGWPMQPGAPGMETLLLLARETPLEGTLDLNRLLSGLPRQAAQTSQALVWFVNGELITGSGDGLRAPKFFDPQQIDDPVLKTQRLVAERLKPHFELIRAVSFANRGE